MSSFLPLLYGNGIYSQAIRPLHNEEKVVIGSLNILREGEYHRIRKEDLIQPLRKVSWKPALEAR